MDGNPSAVVVRAETGESQRVPLEWARQMSQEGAEFPGRKTLSSMVLTALDDMEHACQEEEGLHFTWNQVASYIVNRWRQSSSKRFFARLESELNKLEEMGELESLSSSYRRRRDNNAATQASNKATEETPVATSAWEDLEQGVKDEEDIEFRASEDDEHEPSEDEHDTPAADLPHDAWVPGSPPPGNSHPQAWSKGCSRKMSSAGKRRQRQNKMWTAEEVGALVQALRKYPPGHWERIRRDPEFSALQGRTGIDIKDKYRNLTLHGHLRVEPDGRHVLYSDGLAKGQRRGAKPPKPAWDGRLPGQKPPRGVYAGSYYARALAAKNPRNPPKNPPLPPAGEVHTQPIEEKKEVKEEEDNGEVLVDTASLMATAGSGNAGPLLTDLDEHASTSSGSAGREERAMECQTPENMINSELLSGAQSGNIMMPDSGEGLLSDRPLFPAAL